MKKRILASLMALCLIVGLLPTAALAAEEETEVALEFSEAFSDEDPQYAGEYLISTKESLEALAQAVNAGNTMQDVTFYLQNDIILNDGQFSAIKGNLYYTPSTTDTAYEVDIQNAIYGESEQLTVLVPIGFQAKQGTVQWEKNGFAGKFYGNGHEIKGLFVNGNTVNAEAHYKGLFGALLTGGQISDLTVSGCVYGTGSNTGGIVGKSWGYIDNCHFSGVVMGGYNVGGIVGETAKASSVDSISILKNCTNRAHISAGSLAVSGGNWGGIVGCANGVSIQNCINYGAITSGSFVNVGGIIGVGNADISACINWGSITGPESGTAQGGIVGSHNTGTTNLNFICITTTDELAKYIKPTRPNNTRCATALYLNGGVFDKDIVVSSGTLTAPIKENQIFGGWYVNSDLSGEAVSTLETEKIYYAKWVSRIILIPNGGTCEVSSVDVIQGKPYGNLLPTPTRTGYTFQGWYTEENGGNKVETTAVPAGNTTLYAQWTPNTYTIKFDPNGGTGTMNSIEATYDSVVKLPANQFTNTDAIFAGWATTQTGTTVEHSDGDEVENLTAEQDGTVNLYALWTKKEVLKPDVTPQTKIYNGQVQGFTLDGGFTITYEQDGQAVTAPVNAGVYDVTVQKAATDTTATYHHTVHGGLVIKKAPLTIKADDQSIRAGGALPKFTYTVTGLAGEDPLLKTPVLTCDADGQTVGTYAIKASGADAGANYTITYVDGTLTVSKRSSGGGSSGGSSSSSSTTTETEKNPDGSTTTTVTDKKTGTVTETTKYKDGSTLVVETQKDGTVTTTETAKNGVKVKTVDEPGEDVTAKITVPKSVGEVVVTIPADADYGMVAVDAKTGEVVKLSVPTRDGMTVKLDGSAELVLVDRSRGFTDTRGHWAEDAIDFAAAHELFSGTGDAAFTPDSPMTRAMLMTVLARFDGQDITGGAVWYEKAMAWAKENGISDGSDPDGSITREQLATMLWRYAGSPAGDGSLSAFGDSASVSSYAAEALRWAVGEGLISGTDGGLLAPQGSATRAQVATILMRFVESLTK